MRTHPCSALATAILLAAALPVSAAPTIAEFQVDNNTTLNDEDDDSSDWVEIYNPDATAVNLGGMALTDDILVPQKWVFPSISLGSKSSLLVWCSGKNRTNPARPLHTNFDLAKEGEYLALVAANGTTKLTEFNPYPEQFEDRSYGTSRPVITQTPVAAGAACRRLVPTSTVAGWQATGFVDTLWTAAATGIGYDTNATIDYTPLFGAGGTVPSATHTVLVRIPFAMTNAADVQTVTLRVKYDDGFAAFLNGTRLNPPTAADTNCPASLNFVAAPNPAPLATQVHADSDAVVFQSFDVSAQKSLLINGNNVLAIQVLNQSTSSSDMLMVPELVVTKVDSVALPQTGYFARPTPGTNNSATPVAGFVDAPDFSIKRGFFTTAQSVTLTNNTPGSQIRYTTNGTAPTATTGTVYSGNPITISTSSVLRAGAFMAGWEPSTVKSHSYIFAAQVVNQPAAPAGYPTQWGNEYNFTTGTLTGPAVVGDYRMDPGITTHATYGPLIVPALTTTLPIISLAGDINQIFAFSNGIYSNGRLTAGIELRVSMEFWTPSHSEDWQENAGLRMHGGDAPLEHPKKPFRVYFRKDYGPGRLRQPVFPGSPVDSFDKLQLRPGGHDGWAVPFGSGEILARHATYCRDRYLRKMEMDMGRLQVRGRYTHLYINGLYWGIYDLHEFQSKEFFADHRGGDEAEWDVYEHSNTSNPLFDVVDGTSAAMDAALAFVRPAANIANQAAYDGLGAILDYDEFIDNCLVQMWGAQNDWMGPVFRGIPGVNLSDASRFFNKNWEAGRRSRGSDPTKFLWQTWDAEISMGSSLTNLVPTMRVADFNHTLIGTPTTDIPHTAGTPGPAGEIFYALRKHNAQFRMRVADRIQKHFFNGGAMTTANNQARLLALRTELDLPIVPESARWGDVNSGDPIVVTFNRDEHWRSEMDWLRDAYVGTRNQTLLNQFSAIGMWPATQAPSLSQHGGSVPSGYQLAMTDPNAAGGTIYYTLDGSDPMTSLTTSSVTLLSPGMATECQFKVPTYSYPGNSWKDVTPPWEGVPPGGLTQEQERATWLPEPGGSAPVGVGFDSGANFDYGPHIPSYVLGMEGISPSCYMRVPFTVTAEQKSGMTGLTLRLKYDDGAYIFINGSTPLHRINAPNTPPVHTDVATAAHPDSAAMVYETFDLSTQVPTLVEGSGNLLAIQGLNLTANDDDFLCVPELVATIAVAPPPGAAAQPYTVPVTLPQSGTVKARVLKNGQWSPLTAASFIVGVPASATNITVTEFSYNPIASPAEITAGFSGQQFEFFELMNISANPVEMSGCRFDDGISFTFTGTSIIAPGQRIVLVANQAAFTARHPGVPVFGVFANQSNLSNNGERLELLSASGADIFDFSYGDDPPWPVAPDGGGASLVLINPMSDPDLALPGNWRASAVPGGTPGGADADTYAAWAIRHSVAGGMSDDSNNNGLTNLAEYGLGLIPSSTETDGIYSAQFEIVDVNGTPDTYLVLRYRHQIAADDVIVTPEMSTNMVTWTPLTDQLPGFVTNPDGTEDLARRSPLPVSAGAPLFVRISVTTR